MTGAADREQLDLLHRVRAVLLPPQLRGLNPVYASEARPPRVGPAPVARVSQGGLPRAQADLAEHRGRHFLTLDLYRVGTRAL